MRKIIILATLAAALPFLSGCDVASSAQPDAKETQSEKAAKAANSINFTENAEIDNIKRRLELTSKPGQIGYILLLNQAGQPIEYDTVKGKITSSGKRLTAPVQTWNVDKGEYSGTEMNAAPSDEGTWGSSDGYVYYWDENGGYHQWSGTYLYSDRPIRTRVTPLVINIADHS